MRTHIAPEELARDERFTRLTTVERFSDPRATGEERRIDLRPEDVSDRARSLMNGIFVGEIQALEGAGRTAFDYAAPGEVPFAMKLDMARQCWDEARHCEISVRLSEHMGFELGEYFESITLFEAACHEDPVFRLAGVNRALEGLAIDVFTNMRDFGTAVSDPVLTFAEDWMLADEVTHVKMGSTWLRTLTSDDADRRSAALEFQRTVDGLFNFKGTRGDGDAPLRLARRFREMAGFSTGEIDDIAAMAAADREACAAVSGEHHAGSSGAGRTSHRTSRALVRRHAFSLGVRWRRTGSSTTT